MPFITTKDGTQIFYNDLGKGKPVLFSHGWPLSGDDWERQMLFLGERGYRVIAHDRRSHGRSTQTWEGNHMDQYADDLSELIARSPKDAKFLELGRSCVAKAYRSSQVMQFMWRGLLAYLIRNDIELMFGCASLPGIDPGSMKVELSYLHHFCAVPPELPRVRALPERFVDMNLIPKDALNEQEALHELPPLVKGYIRAGAYIGDGAVIDHQFATTDVFIYFPTARLDKRLRAFLSKHLKRDGPTAA